MYDFFEKHGKKTLAVLGSILILAFLMPSTMGHGSGPNRAYGKIAGAEIDADEVAATHTLLASVSRLAVQSRSQQPGAGGGLVKLPEAVFSQQEFGNLAGRLAENPLLWYLLVQDANQSGVTADEQQLDTLIASPNIFLIDPSLPKPTSLKDISQYNAGRVDEFKPGLRAILAIRKNFDRRRESIKFTKPMVEDAMVRQNQQIRARLAAFKASDFVKDLTPPTDEELRAQFDAYAADPAGMATTRNPFGFGYRVPDRLRLQWIEVPKSEVTRVIESSKPAEIWDEDAIIYYQKNQQQFQTETTVSPLVSPAAKPSTRPFAEAKADVLEKMRQPQVDQLQRKIVARLTQQMSLDAQRARDKGPTTQQASDSVTGLGVPLGSGEYLQKLAAETQKQFGVKLTVVNNPAPLSQVELTAAPGIGTAGVDDRTGVAAESQGGPAYVFESCKALSDDVTRLGSYDLLQPAKTLLANGSLYVVRATAAEPSHPPRSLDEARTAVERDVQAKKSFARASEAAQKFIDAAAAAGGFDKATGATVQTTEWLAFNAFELTGAKDIPNGYELIEPIFNQLRGLSSASQLPVRTVIKRQSNGSAVAVELFDVRTKLSTADAEQARMMALQMAMRGLISPVADQQLIADWFSMDGVSRRIGFVPDAGSPVERQSKSAPPVNPFVPG